MYYKEHGLFTMKKEGRFFIQLIKYGLVGVLNTLLTVIVIWIILFLFSEQNDQNHTPVFVMVIANITGYTVGIINSYILNRNWTFKSNSDWRGSFIRFLIAFGICYIIQLGIVLWLNSLNISFRWQTDYFIITWPYVCQLIGIVIYSLLNFLLNKYYTFKVNKRTV